MLPDLSHLQFLVLGELKSDERAGRDIRATLRQFRVRQSGPAFYQMMARLEKTGLAEGWYTQDVVDGQVIKERRYRITRDGLRSWRECRDFYQQAIDASGDGGLARA